MELKTILSRGTLVTRALEGGGIRGQISIQRSAILTQIFRDSPHLLQADDRIVP